MGGSRTVPTVRRKISGHPQLPPTTKSPAPLCASTHWSIVFIVLVQLHYTNRAALASERPGRPNPALAA